MLWHLLWGYFGDVGAHVGDVSAIFRGYVGDNLVMCRFRSVVDMSLLCLTCFGDISAILIWFLKIRPEEMRFLPRGERDPV